MFRVSLGDMGASTQATISCADLEAAMAAYEALGFRLDMIMPADAPRLALMSADGVALRLESERVSEAGRAGMLYRDLIPGRLSGRVIASHIRIPDGGPVPDYVHYHHVRFQMIYCAKGWVRVVYEDQGEPFVMREGDCVYQPPGIRHRVLESSPGLEVIEVTAPAEHETWRDHDMALPQPVVHRDRTYGGQRFVRHIAAEAKRVPAGRGCWMIQTDIASATNGSGSVQIYQFDAGASTEFDMRDEFDKADMHFAFAYLLSGKMRVDRKGGPPRAFAAGNAIVIEDGVAAFVAEMSSELLFVWVENDTRRSARENR